MARGSQLAKKTLIDTRKPGVKGDLLSALKSRITPEIVVGFVGPIASGVTTTSQELEKLISESYGYETNRIRLSELIEKNADRVGIVAKTPTKVATRVEHLQRAGTALRQAFGAGYLAAKAIELISIGRGKSGFADEGLQNPNPRRLVHIVDSIKNEQEAEVFRLVYGSAFWLVGVFAPRTVRTDRLVKSGYSATEAATVIDRDEHEGPNHGQDVRETFYSSDYFVKNAGESKDAIDPSIRRRLSAIFEDKIVTPTTDERGMAGAKQSAAASACMSRQVGAVVVGRKGSILGSGWNEVPKAGGGVYDGEEELDARCFKYLNKNCRNDDRKDKLYVEIFNALKPHLSQASEMQQVAAALRGTSVRSLIEYSRSVHAEMAAIVDVARSGRASLIDSTMYVTTFPCHNCARHIVASGIARVVYVEPYPKSLAFELHGDALVDGSLSDVANDMSSVGKARKVVVEPFQGVGPSRFFSVFLMRDERKENGKLKDQPARSKLPADSESLDAFATLEKRVVEHVANAEAEHETA
ncbi:MAG: hypothetical protein IV086_10540 [Hyphomonadaceae bacterium]|nr:hypothetical protein [Hyphomonadaceae bacterium]